MTDNDILYQLLNLEKQLSHTYNKVTIQCLDNKLRSELSSVLENQNNIVFSINDEILKRNSTKPAKSSNEEINMLKEQYSKIIPKL